MGLPFDDFTEEESASLGAQPGGVDTARWFEAEASGPGLINMFVSITGTALLKEELSMILGPGDGTIAIDTGYGIDPATDTAENLVDGNAELLHSTFVSLAGIRADDVSGRDCWIETVDAELRPVGTRRRNVFVIVQLNIDGDLALTRLGYNVVALFGSTRMPSVGPEAPNSGSDG